MDICHARLVSGLKNESRFPLILHDGCQYYGGDQDWFSDPVFRNGGCGIVAAANLIAYQYPEILKKYSSYEEYLMKVALYIRPWRLPGGRTMGIWPASRLSFGIRRFLYHQVLPAVPEPIQIDTLSSLSSMEHQWEWLVRHLDADEPVAMLIGHNHRFNMTQVERPDGFTWVQKNFARHWVTITAVCDTESESNPVGERFLKVSTWGGISYLKLKDWKHGGVWPQSFLSIHIKNGQGTT